MSDVIKEAIETLTQKFTNGFDSVVKFNIVDEGTIMLDSDGVRVGDEEADVTMTAEADVFREILDGERSPTTAFMTGKLKVDGSMGLAMKLAAQLS